MEKVGHHARKSHSAPPLVALARCLASRGLLPQWVKRRIWLWLGFAALEEEADALRARAQRAEALLQAADATARATQQEALRAALRADEAQASAARATEQAAGAARRESKALTRLAAAETRANQAEARATVAEARATVAEAKASRRHAPEVRAALSIPSTTEPRRGLATPAQRNDELRRRAADLSLRVSELARRLDVWETTEWMAAWPVAESQLISVVVVAQRSRVALARALRSVLAQSYGRFEVVVVDDTDDAAALGVVSELADGRIRPVSGARRGQAAAGNRGLAAARGQYVTYLGEDEVMGPHWLRALAWAIARRPSAEVFHAAGLRAPFATATAETYRFGVDNAGQGRLVAVPSLHPLPGEGSSAELAMVSHRRELPEAHFDEGLADLARWDLLWRLSRRYRSVFVPVVAVCGTEPTPVAAEASPPRPAEWRLPDIGPLPRSPQRAAEAGLRGGDRLQALRRDRDTAVPAGTECAGALSGQRQVNEGQ